jgi:hypothetical protein
MYLGGWIDDRQIGIDVYRSAHSVPNVLLRCP